jgi:hypothetical protein
MAAPKVTAQQQQRLVEYFKCKNDPIYFMEKYIQLSLAGGDVNINLYDRQKDYIKTILTEHHVITNKSRQTGVSTITQMFCVYACTFFKNVVIGIVSKAGPESTDFCRKVLKMIDTLPEWLRPKFDKRAEQSFITDNGCQFYADQVNQANPEGLLRGKALTILILDEAAHISKIDDAYTGVAPTLFKSQTMAKQNKIPYATLIISTPNKTVGTGKWFYQNWTKALNNESIFKSFKLHWKMIKEFVEDPTWYKTQCDLLGNVHWKISQELEMQFIASSNSFLPSETIEKLNSGYIDPISKMRLEKQEFWLFEKPDPRKFYLIGIDTASRSGSDMSSVVVMDFETFNQVAEFRAKMRVDDFCKVLYLLNKVYPNNLIIPEANSYGNQVCEYLTTGDIYYNIYQTKVKDKTIAEHSKRPKYKYGLYTTPQTRPLMIDALYTYVVEDPSIVKSERLSLELIGLVDNGNGKVAADEGEHDDLAMALAFCAYVRLYDPPLGFSRDVKNPGVLEDMESISKWNEEKGTPMSSDIEGIREFESDDKFEIAEHSNKLIGRYVKDNLHKMIADNQQGTTIDILKLLDLRNQKNQKM